MLFIIQHQVAELWMKLMIHELRAAIAYVRADALEPCFKILARVKLIQKQLFEQWAVLETLTPSEYEGVPAGARHVVGLPVARSTARSSSCSATRTPAMLDVFRHDAATYAELDALLHAPSLYDEFLRHLARRGLPVPRETLERDCHAAVRAQSRRSCRCSRRSTTIPRTGGTRTTCARSWSTSRRASSSGASAT